MSKRTPESILSSKKVKFGVLGALALGAVLLTGPKVVEGINLAQDTSDQDFKETGGVDIKRVPETNIYSVRMRSSVGNAFSKDVVIDGALRRIAVDNAGCNLSTPWRLSTENSTPKQLKDVYYVSVFCPPR